MWLLLQSSNSLISCVSDSDAYRVWIQGSVAVTLGALLTAPSRESTALTMSCLRIIKATVLRFERAPLIWIISLTPGSRRPLQLLLTQIPSSALLILWTEVWKIELKVQPQSLSGGRESSEAKPYGLEHVCDRAMESVTTSYVERRLSG